MVRIRQDGQRDVDVIVGRHAWQQQVLDRAVGIGDQVLRVVTAPALILVKLFACGSQDRWDIDQLLALDARLSCSSV